MPPIQNTIPENTTLSKPKPRAKLKHSVIPVDFLYSRVMLAVRRKFGDISALAIIEIIQQLSKSGNAEIHIDEALGVISSLRIEQDEALLAYCVEMNVFQKLPGDLITRAEVIKDSENLAADQVEWKLKNEKKKKNKEESGVYSGVTPECTPGYCEDLYNEDLNSEDLNSNPKQGGSKGGAHPEAPKSYANALPESLDTPEIRDALGNWLIKQVKLHKPRDQMAIDALAANWSNRPKEFLHAIRESTANGWKTLIEPKSTAGPPNGRISYEKETNYERNLRIIREA